MDINTEDLKLFDQETAMMIVLLKLLGTSKKWLTVQEMASASGASTKTVEKYVKLIQVELAESRLNDMALRHDKKKGYFLYMLEDGMLTDFILVQLQATLAYKLMYGIFFENITSVTRFAQANYVSESTVWRVLNELRERILPYGLDIKKGSFQLIGQESQVRQYSHSVMWLFFKGAIWPFPQLSEGTIMATVSLIEAFFGCQLSQLKRQRLAYYLAIIITRSQKQHRIQVTRELLENTEENPLFQRFCQQLMSQFVELKWCDDEWRFLFCVLMTRDELYQSPKIRAEIQQFHRQKRTALFQSLRYLEQIFQERLKINMSFEKEQLLLDYAYSSHQFCQLFHGFSLDINGHLYWNRTKDKYPRLIEALSELIDELQQKTGNLIFAERSFLITRYLIMYATIADLPRLESPLTILLVTDLPVLEEQRVILRLQRAYQQDYHLRIVTEERLSESYQLILSTSKVTQKALQAVPNVIFDTELTKEDYADLDAILWQLFSTSQS